MNFKVGDKIKITGYYNTDEIGVIENIEIFEGDIEFWIRIEGFKRLVLCHDGEFIKVEE